MKRGLHILLALGLVIVWVGCQKPAAPPEPNTQASSSEASSGEQSSPDEGEFTLVSLKVPNMT